jgi:N-acetylglucosaminyldiphosphoundecaprenol N-acetyl-beta-D-mannosaminyltransferase
MTEKIDFLGLPIDDLGADAAAALIAARPANQPFAYVVTPNAQHLVRLAADEGVWRQAYDGAWLRLSDGHVVQRLARLILGLRLPYASGSDITMRLVRHHIAPDDAVTVIGGGAALEAALKQKFGWRNLALFDPPFGLLHDAKAQADCLDFLRAHPARYVFLAIGSPQGEWIASQAARMKGLTGVGLCIGGSLLFATGLVKRAPHWLRQLGLEGLFRLIQRPRSHFRRVFRESLPVIWLLIKGRFGGHILR